MPSLVGSEMCIRDSATRAREGPKAADGQYVRLPIELPRSFIVRSGLPFDRCCNSGSKRRPAGGLQIIVQARGVVGDTVLQYTPVRHFRRFHRQKIALYASDCILTSNSVPIPAAKVCSSLRGMCCGSASKPRRNGKKQVRGRLDEFWGESRGWRENSSKEPSDVTATCGASRARPQEEQLYVVAVADVPCPHY